MRRLALLIPLLAVTQALVACGPPMNAVVGIGLEDDGELVVVVKVCDEDITSVRLDRYDPDALVRSWHRDRPLTATERFPLDGPGSRHWHPDSRGALLLEPATDYGMDAVGSADYSTGWMSFTGKDVAQLEPGQLLVRRPDAQRTGRNAPSTTVIDRDDLAQWSCGY